LDPGLNPGDQLELKLQDLSPYAGGLNAARTYETGKLTSLPSFPISHGLGVVPTSIVIQHEGHVQALKWTNLNPKDYCDVDATEIDCSFPGGFTVDGTHRLRIVVSTATIPNAVIEDYEVFRENQVLLDELEFEDWGSCTTGICSSIKGRAPIKNFAALRPSFGINRITTQKINLLSTESGPNGEPIYGIVNDEWGQLRLSGNWRVSDLNLGYGVQISNVDTTFREDEFIEITFYGTGLNILMFSQTSAGYNVDVSIDGGADVITTDWDSKSTVLRSRFYAENSVYSVASGLSLGWHTIRIRGDVATATRIRFYGFEILNESSTVDIPPGSAVINGKKVTTTTTQSLAYDSCPGTTGGRVVVYLNKDGTVGSVCNEPDGKQFMTNSDHSNEEVIREYFWREFGASQTCAGCADFSLSILAGPADYAFTLDDDTTTLIGNNARLDNGSELLGQHATGPGHYDVTFVGTGFAIVGDTGLTGVQASAYVDSQLAGGVFGIGAGEYTYDIASGFPYGTHTVRIIRAGNGLQTRKFIVYGPKKPAIPSDALELGEYNVLADPSAPTGTTADKEQIADGVIRKANIRELVYVNGTGGTTDWAVGALTWQDITGFSIATDRLNAYFTYTFYGTGFDMRFKSSSTAVDAAQMSLSVSGGAFQNLTTTNFPTMTASHYGNFGVEFFPATGLLDQHAAAATDGSGVTIRNLPLNLYTLKVENVTEAGEYLSVSSIDVFMATHIHKQNTPHTVQNTLAVGSQSLLDTRFFGNQLINTPITGVAESVLTSSWDISDDSFIPMPDMLLTLKLDKPSILQFKDSWWGTSCSGICSSFARLLVDGKNVTSTVYELVSTTNILEDTSHTLYQLYLPIGFHTIQTHVRTGTGDTIRHGANTRNITVHQLSN
jgi:hypothetical protein